MEQEITPSIIHNHLIKSKFSIYTHYTRSMFRSSKSRYDVSPSIYEKDKDPSLLDQVLSFGGGLGDTIAHSLGFSYSEEETEASSLMTFEKVKEDSRNDDFNDEVSLRYEMWKKSKEKENETRVDPEDDYLQQNLRNIYKKKQKNGVFTKIEDDDLSLDLSLAASDDLIISVDSSNSFESEITERTESHLRNYYSHSECTSFEEKPPKSCRKPVSALKKTQKVQMSKKKSFHRKKSASVEEPVEENKRVKWIDQIAADFDPYLFEMRRDYAKNMANVRLAMDEHNLIMEKIMKVNTIGLCGELAEM